MTKRTVFYLSDGTGITAETLGRSLLTQFPDIQFEQVLIPYVNDEGAAIEAATKLRQAYDADGVKPLLFSTIVDPLIRKHLDDLPCVPLDFFSTFIGPLERELDVQSAHTVGSSHGMQNFQHYMIRIDAINYALSNDDGMRIDDYDDADFILLGTSRSGKTPTCLYLAMQFGLFAANYPFTEDNLHELALPKTLDPHRSKLFGLTIDPHRLCQIRQTRRPGSPYSSLKQCEWEVKQAEKIFKKEAIPYLNTSARSVEEISTEILKLTGVKRKTF